MRDYVKEYRKNRDAFLTCADFIQFHPGISEASKTEVLNAIVQDLIKPNQKEKL